MTTSHPRLRALIVATPLLLCLATAACGADHDDDEGAGSSPDRVEVVASTDVWGDIASQLGGDLVDVHSIITDPEQDPHSFEADATTLLAVKQAALVIENGGGYDDFMQTLLSSTGSSAPVLDAVDISGKTATGGTELNEHVWYDLPTAVRVADRIADQLSTLDPTHAATYAANVATFDSSVTRLEAREATVRTAVSGESIGITEPVPLYMSAALGLTNLTPPAYSEAVEEGSDVSATTLQATLDLYSQHRVRALVYNEQTSGPISEKVEDAARAAGVAIVPVTETLPSGDDYQTWMGANLDHLAAALS